MRRCADAKVCRCKGKYTRACTYGRVFLFSVFIFILHYIASAFAALDITTYDRIGYVHYYVSEQ